MAIVADTSQINYLVLIDQIEILPRLYTRVLIPVKINTFMRHDCNTSVEPPPLSTLHFGFRPVVAYLVTREQENVALTLMIPLGVKMSGESG